MVTDKAKPVVVGVDGTDTAMNAARWAAAVAQKFTAPLLIANGTSSDRHLPWAVGEAVRQRWSPSGGSPPSSCSNPSKRGCVQNSLR